MAKEQTETLARRLEGVRVFDLDDNEVPIESLWRERDRATVLIFIRHFG